MRDQQELNCSIVWWKDYIRLGFNSKPENYKERKMNTTLCYLRNNEEDGLCCTQIRYSSIPVTNVHNIPVIFKRYNHKAVTA